jgi:hypothetical protein
MHRIKNNLEESVKCKLMKWENEILTLQITKTDLYGKKWELHSGSLNGCERKLRVRGRLFRTRTYK